MKKKVVSFLVSGRGSNFTVVAKKIISGEIDARLGVVISDNGKAKALEIAPDFGMGSFFVDPALYSSRKDHEIAMEKLLNEHRTDLVVAAGYMRILSPYFVGKFRGRIINIHPALLPSFPGAEAQNQALKYGVKITGCTAHFIDEGTDTGPIILQAAVHIHEEDTLTSLSVKILREEHRILPLAVKYFCEGRLKIVGKSVVIK